ncbi:MAG: glutathione S-transferase [Rhizobiales bacterium]|nr:glutathione S-transferase [Hyphomicrobiales bacterium]
MLLHHNPASPFVRMVRVVAHETGQMDDIQTEVAAVLPIERHEAISSANPLGRIPALVTDEGHGVFDSRVICAYLAHRAGNTNIHPSTDFRVMTLFALAQGLCDTAVNLRYETALRPESLRWDQWMARQNERIFAALDDLDANWQAQLSGLHVGSIGVAVALAYLDFRYPDLGWRDGRANLSAFYDSFSQRPSMQNTKPE